ncbi:hypothetical protein H0H92_002025 [Tricholoma furcatifolium]|nr:hypothetical protein H0H92_002025 [Tricholoma furcatifolium]
MFELSGSDSDVFCRSIENELRYACSWIGAEKILNPLIPGLLRLLNDDAASSILEVLIATPKIPKSFIERVAVHLIQRSVSATSSSEGTKERRLLSVIQQRHPESFQKSMDITSQ